MAQDVTTRYVVDADGVVSALKSQEVSGIVSGVHAIPDVYDGKRAVRAGQRLYASVPNVIALHWANEAGVRLYSKEWREIVRRKLASNEFRAFVVDWRR